MDFLYVLEGLRMEPVTSIMSALTYLGTQYVFVAIGLIMLWCISKRQAYYLFAVSLLGTIANQWLKLLFCIPRPWVLDSSFSIVESAREMAAGYSFPSGHTQAAVGTFAAIAIANKRRWLRVACVIVIALVPFSRMYLGVHTPLDVGVAFACAIAVAFALWPCFKDEQRFTACTPFVLGGAITLCIAFTVWVNVNPFPADVDAENLAEGMKNAWQLLGLALGLAVSYYVDQRFLHFEVKAPLPGQILKCVLGIALFAAIYFGLKPLLAALFGAVWWPYAIRTFLAVLFVGCLWPLTFPFFARIGAK
ncbi:MAG: phosphatase PAP2 family protein [Coriobacteriaceae bacterium]|nr:phosphatase PAP2 family protein [Coriobacteriaceae bacterium]MDO4889865.1 phosphatase PAP2 family protein [Coriobacteriaceae bacterium]